MSSAELLWACRVLATELDVVGADVVEGIPTAIGASDLTALVAARAVHELLTGIGAAKSAQLAARPGRLRAR
jgi:agmatinase